MLAKLRNRFHRNRVRRVSISVGDVVAYAEQRALEAAR